MKKAIFDQRYYDDSLLDEENEVASTLPKEFFLFQNYPNPFNPSTTIQFALPQVEKVNIEIHSVLGKRIATLLDKTMPAGHHMVEFDAQNLANGVYVFRIEAGAFRAARKMLYLK